MGGYFDRGASAGGHDDGYFSRPDVTGPEGVGSATGGPGGVVREDLEVDPEHPNMVRATPHERSDRVDVDETGGSTSTQRVEGTYPAIIEGSDSERTGTSWGLPPVERALTVETPQGKMAEGDEPGEAAPNRNTADRLAQEQRREIGSWSTIDNDAGAGSSTGNS